MLVESTWVNQYINTYTSQILYDLKALNRANANRQLLRLCKNPQTWWLFRNALKWLFEYGQKVLRVATALLETNKAPQRRWENDREEAKNQNL